ncbi:alanine racemase [Aestuariibacter halophilus]|uniref:Alanine racemase n=1 Tax=Fluctibacter halophilus TaxID=226011 RepID=A0ABS8G4G0_9ALTE|nr:alanine racemase [Aestuariibacter halophilus]MCC2615368.1 alanine racemase [Aestuariibacter halophilus]
MSRPTEITIDLQALSHNVTLTEGLAPNSHHMAVIKADAYGHGACDIARALEGRVRLFAVSSLDEAVVLRDEGIHTPILLLEGCFDDGELKTASALGFHTVLHNESQLTALQRVPLNSPMHVWLKVDTGMHRLGIPSERVHQVFEKLRGCENVEDITLLTHLACADSVDTAMTVRQLDRFRQVMSSLPTGLPRSIANSAAILAHPQSHTEWNRPGIMLYGLSPFEHAHPAADRLKPVMTFHSEVIAVRDIPRGESVGYGAVWTATRPSTIATVAVGYGDGYPRNARNGTPVLVKGQRASLAGRVSMDMITVDVTEIGDVKVGDPVELWGQQLNANEVAQWADTIGYELVTRMPKRTPRRIVT